MKTVLKCLLLVTLLASFMACQSDSTGSAAPAAPEKVVLELEGAGQ
ncbi:MAG: hypothetical protein HYV97_01245 [Bdellovibrio sp.]|nr:hypothetical protein [Bdellovibrio sp.]